MEPRADGWSIVIPGRWNVSIFGPDWVGEHLFGGAELQVEFPLTPGFSPRCTANGITVWLEGERLRIDMQAPDEQSLAEAERAACEILELLPYTPVSAVGVNFGFREASPSTWLLGLFDLGDDDRIEATGYPRKSTQLTRQLECKDRLLNLSLRKSDDEAVDFDFNFHETVADAPTAQDALCQKTGDLREAANGFLQNVYTKAEKETD